MGRQSQGWRDRQMQGERKGTLPNLLPNLKAAAPVAEGRDPVCPALTVAGTDSWWAGSKYRWNGRWTP